MSDFMWWEQSDEFRLRKKYDSVMSHPLAIIMKREKYLLIRDNYTAVWFGWQVVRTPVKDIEELKAMGEAIVTMEGV